MACPDYFTGLRIATEHLNDELYTIPSPDTPYYNYITRGAFPMNAGVNMTAFTMGRVEPTSSTTGWADVSLSNNTITGAACVANYTGVDVGFNETTYAPRKLQLRGPYICRETLGFAHNVTEMMSYYVMALSQLSKSKIDLEFRNRTMAFSNKMSIAANGFSNVFTGTTPPTIKPTSQLTWPWLDGVASRLIAAGAENPNDKVIKLPMGEGGIQFPAFIGIDALNALFTNVSAIREDYRAADMGKGAMAATIRALGGGRAYKNFRFVPVTNPPRFTWNNTTLVAVEQFEDSALTHGTGQVETAAYQNAEYEAVVIPTPWQWKADLVSPSNAGLKFDPTTWNGDWQFITGGERIVNGNVCYDPKHNWGAHFADFLYAPHPMRPNLGWVLYYKRCQNDQTLAVCTSGV